MINAVEYNIGKAAKLKGLSRTDCRLESSMAVTSITSKSQNFMQLCLKLKVHEKIS